MRITEAANGKQRPVQKVPFHNGVRIFPFASGELYQKFLDQTTLFLNGTGIRWLIEGLEAMPDLDPTGRFAISVSTEQVMATNWWLTTADGKVDPYIAQLLSDHYRPTSALYYLALRSLIRLVWNLAPTDPQTAEDVVNTELTLNNALFDCAKHLSEILQDPPPMPGWAAVSYHNLIAYQPDNEFARTLADRVRIVVLKSHDPNCFAINHPDGPIIALDIALEPMLYQFNTVAVSASSLRDSPLHKRYSHVLFYQLMPIAMYFSRRLAIHEIPLPAFLVGMEEAKEVGRITDLQTQFLLAHELGHIALGHNSTDRLYSLPTLATEITQPVVFRRRHIQEYEADLFAANYFRSMLMNCAIAKWICCDGAEFDDAVKNTMPAAMEWSSLVELLFVMMIFVEEATELIDLAFGGLPRRVWSTHPPARARRDRLRHHGRGDLNLRSELVESAEQMTQSVLQEARIMSKEELRERIERIAYGFEGRST